MRAFTRSSAVLTLALATGFAAPALQAKPGGPKHSPAHDAAVQRCTDEYEARAAAAHAPNAPTGQARKRAMRAAAKAKESCIARAPK